MVEYGPLDSCSLTHALFLLNVWQRHIHATTLAKKYSIHGITKLYLVYFGPSAYPVSIW